MTSSPTWSCTPTLNASPEVRQHAGSTRNRRRTWTTEQLVEPIEGRGVVPRDPVFMSIERSLWSHPTRSATRLSRRWRSAAFRLPRSFRPLP